MTRKDFLFAAAAAGTSFAFGAAPKTGNRPLLKVGIMSDIHVRRGSDVDTGKDGWGTEDFEKVITAYRDLGVDAIMIPGDMADWGLVSQLVEVGQAWERVFPGNRGLGGRKVEKLFIYGNHDYYPAFSFSEKHLVKRYMGLADQAARDEYAKVGGISVDFAKAWDKAFHEAWSREYTKTVKGFTFIGANWGSEGGRAAAFLSKVTPKLDPKKPFFFFQHRALGGTCWANRGIPKPSLDSDGGETTKLLSAYPNAISFAGHNHYTLTDPETIWRGPFTAFGCSSLRFVSKVPPSGGWPKESTWRDRIFSGGPQSMFMTVYADEIVVESHQWDVKAGTKAELVPAWHVRRPVV